MSPQENLKIALLQIPLVWEDAAANQASIEGYLQKLRVKPDLVVLPEMFNSGFTMNVEGVGQNTENGETISWLQRVSADYGLAITGSIIARDGEKFYNRMLWVEDGILKAVYDKRHLFRMAGEDHYFSPGKKSPVITYKGWRILMRVCYDLRFPVWNRSTDIDLQIYVANWPKPRTIAWDKLLMARAIENQCYVVGVNRVGSDGNKVEYIGHSIAIDAKGEAITERATETAGWIIANLSYTPLAEFREKFPLALDADKFEILD
jgi:predicted amidohydrolase